MGEDVILWSHTEEDGDSTEVFAQTSSSKDLIVRVTNVGRSEGAQVRYLDEGAVGSLRDALNKFLGEATTEAPRGSIPKPTCPSPAAHAPRALVLHPEGGPTLVYRHSDGNGFTIIDRAPVSDSRERAIYEALVSHAQRLTEPTQVEL